MTLSTRERTIAIVMALALGALLGDSYVFSPLYARYQSDRDGAAALEQQVLQTDRLLRQRRTLEREMQHRVGNGLASEVSQAESNMLNALEKFAGEARLNVSSMKPEREPVKNGLQVIRCRLTLTGSMSAFCRFCWSLENSPMPLRVEKIQIAASDPTRDAQSIQVQVSTVCLPAGQPRAVPATQEQRP